MRHTKVFIDLLLLSGTVVTSLWRSDHMEIKYSLISNEPSVAEAFPDREDEPGSFPFGLSSTWEVVAQGKLDHEANRVHKVTVINQTLTTPPLIDYMTISIVVSFSLARRRLFIVPFYLFFARPIKENLAFVRFGNPWEPLVWVCLGSSLQTSKLIFISGKMDPRSINIIINKNNNNNYRSIILNNSVN